MLSDLEKLRTYYYNKYKRLLTDKVEKQRRKIRQQKDKSENEAQEIHNSQVLWVVCKVQSSSVV